jgi:hypothetical protein
MYAEAVAEFEKTQKALPGWPVATAAAGWVYGTWGKTSEARKTLTELNAQSKHRYVSAYALALVHASLRDKNEALQFLDLGLKERTNWMVWAPLDQRWQPLRNDPRFQQLLSNIETSRNEPHAKK